MAAVQALLSAAGVLKPNTKLLKKSTATEHATSSSQSDPATTSNATEHAVSRLPLTWIQMFTSKHHAQLLLEKIVALLVWMAQDFQSDFKTDEIPMAQITNMRHVLGWPRSNAWLHLHRLTCIV